MWDPLRKLMLRFDDDWDNRSNFRKIERYLVLLLYAMLLLLFVVILLNSKFAA